MKKSILLLSASIFSFVSASDYEESDAGKPEFSKAVAQLLSDPDFLKKSCQLSAAAYRDSRNFSLLSSDIRNSRWGEEWMGF